jgi:hypothetical protein
MTIMGRTSIIGMGKPDPFLGKPSSIKLSFSQLEGPSAKNPPVVRFGLSKTKQNSKSTPNLHPKIIRLVLNGESKVSCADEILKKAFENWPKGVHAKFLTTPGGFMEVPWPKEWNGKAGWDSLEKNDFKCLENQAAQAIQKLMSPKMLALAKNKVDFITLGIDVATPEAVKKPHAELVVVYDVKHQKIVGFTGKSYPLGMQEKNLVQANLESHFFTLGKERLMVLGCNDLNVFNPRVHHNTQDYPEGSRFKRWSDMLKKALAFQPTVILHHPHATDTANSWLLAWSFVKKNFTTLKAWTSGIGYYNYESPGLRRQPLQKVLDNTASSSDQVVNLVIDTSSYVSLPGMYLRKTPDILPGK